MFEVEFLNSDIFRWIILPLLIFAARVVDVSLGTIRIVFVSKGKKTLAPIFGFIEVIIWLLAISQIIRNLDNVICYIAYGGGFAMGTFVGLLIEERLALGTLLIRVITRMNARDLIASLRTQHYGVTSIPAMGPEGDVNVIYSVIRREDLKKVIDIIKRFNPNAFYSIEDVKFVSEGIFPLKQPASRWYLQSALRWWRKGK
ncbi:MAG: DUF2179 domain-containing protein [bacterium]|nr:MAG: DUF2179 domain-containing protein [bacterium]